MLPITLKQLRAFSAVARYQNFTRAAESLGLTQSALTITVKDLEGQLGLKLFDRSTRAVHLTQGAIGFLGIVEHTLEQLDHGVAEMRAVADRKKGSVTIAAASSFLNEVLAPTVVDLALKEPGISVRLIEDRPESVVQHVLKGDVDFGVTTLWHRNAELDSTVILQDVFGVLIRTDHPLAQIGSLRWRHLMDYPLISPTGGASIHHLISQNARLAGMLKLPRYEVSSYTALEKLVRNGVGVAILPSLAAGPLCSEIATFFKLTQPLVTRRLYVVVREGRTLSPAAHRVAELMKIQLATVASKIRDIQVFG